MTITLVIKAAGIGVIIAVFAMANGVLREKLLVPNIGNTKALPMSGMTLSLLVFLITYFSIPALRKHTGTTFIFIGSQWVLMTILFEIVFGHCVAKKSWKELAQVLNVFKGDLFTLVLLSSLLSPYLTAGLRGMLE